jgi:hypothetical protein
VRFDSHLAIEGVRAAAERQAATFGHTLGEWDDRSENGAEAFFARCVRCGLTVYVRREGDLTGAAGSALGERCRPAF